MLNKCAQLHRAPFGLDRFLAFGLSFARFSQKKYDQGDDCQQGYKWNYHNSFS